MEEYIIRKYQDGDEKEINDLFNEIFHETRSLKEWFWKFKKGPLGHVNISFVAESKGKIVGQYANLPLLFKYKEKVLRVAFPVDNFVHPEFRGGMKGIQKEMFEYQNQFAPENNIFFGFGFPNREAYIVGNRILKYKDLGEMPVLFRRLNWRLALKKRLPWVSPSILRIIQFISSIGYRILFETKNINRLKDLKVRQIDSFDERLNTFLDKIKEQYEIIGKRDQQYLNWRYKKPRSSYQILIAEKGDEVVGYIVTKIKEGADERVGYIVDLLTDNTFGVDSALIKEALLGFISKKVDFVICWMLPDKKSYVALCSLGFIQRDDFPSINIVYFIFNPNVVEETFLKDPKNWYLTMGDSDTL